ncbi:60S ribosomal protein L13a-like [Triticum aestivum]|uniref:60S ribosomal protein L13a-like n=1 Tax=Triticum aestivum TaxID=4565 RepID=UPI001D013101|nr:60S ribosomal protein L13a-like [Triticum aestivum]
MLPRLRYRTPAAPPPIKQPLPPAVAPSLEQALLPSNAAARSYAGDQSVGRLKPAYRQEYYLILTLFFHQQSTTQDPLGRRHHWDAHHHMLGHLASIITKELLNGQRLVVVRFEEICMSGGLVHQNMKYLRFLCKRMNTKPSHGPIHFRAPAKILWRTIRGMIPHKTARGEAVLAKLKAYEGVPLPYDRTKRMVIPDALKVLRLQPRHKHCLLGQLSKEVGWNYADTIRELQA